MTIDRLAERTSYVAVLGLVALAAYFQASLASHLLAAALVAHPVAVRRGAESAGSEALGTFSATRAAKTADAILSRNAFDSVTGSVIDKVTESAEAARAGPIDLLAAPGCDGVRVAMITESPDPRWSLVTLQISGETAPKLLRLGDEVTGRQVAFIGYNPRENSPAVWLTANSSVCQALLLRGVPAPVAAAAQPPAIEPRTAGVLPPALADIASQTRRISDTEFEADRGVIDKVMNNQVLLMQSVRIVPEQKDGKVVGLRLLGIRPDTLLGILGLQNGDRLESINGFDMASPQKMLEAYARLPAANRLTVKLNRHGQSMSIDYRLK